MISRSGNEGFFKAHWDWLVAVAGVLVLLASVGFFVLSCGDDPAEKAAAATRALGNRRSGGTGVKPLDMSEYARAVRLIKTPPSVAAVMTKAASFLASEKRVFCKCERAIPGDVKAFPTCPFCGEKQEEEKPVVVDADGDGLPNEWEIKYGLNPNDPSDADKDMDGDGFTNKEEFLAKTDPSDKASHPDYLDSLKVTLPLKQTFLPFFFMDVQSRPSGTYYVFRNPTRKNEYGHLGVNLSAKKGEKLADTGFKVLDYVKREQKVAIRGGQGMMRSVDVSQVIIQRESDGLKLTLTINNDRAKPQKTPVEVQAKLVYERNGTKEFIVVAGSTIELNGMKYKVNVVKAEGKGALVELENTVNGQKRSLKAVEQ